MRKDTLLFLLDSRNDNILLAMKKRGFGAGKYNGVGGKVKDNEHIEAAAVREAQEEIGVIISQNDLSKKAVLNFSFEQKPEWTIECHVFTTNAWRGEPQESEEMAPQWFALDVIPYEHMWVDDKHWLPRVLAGEILEADFHFNSDGSAILRQNIKTLL